MKCNYPSERETRRLDRLHSLKLGFLSYLLEIFSFLPWSLKAFCCCRAFIHWKKNKGSARKMNERKRQKRGRKKDLLSICLSLSSLSPPVLSLSIDTARMNVCTPACVWVRSALKQGETKSENFHINWKTWIHQKCKKSWKKRKITSASISLHFPFLSLSSPRCNYTRPSGCMYTLGVQRPTYPMIEIDHSFALYGDVVTYDLHCLPFFSKTFLCCENTLSLLLLVSSSVLPLHLQRESKYLQCTMIMSGTSSIEY